MLLLLFGSGGGAGNVYPSAATATGTAYNATVTVTAAAGQAAATGTAYDATVSTGPVTVNPSAATATGTAYNATVKVSATAQTAYGVGGANDPLLGEQVSGPADLRRTVLVDVNGNTVATLGNAVQGPISKTLNDHDTASFVLPASDPDVALIAGSTGVRFREVQLWRGDRLLIWGPIVDWAYNGDTVSFDVVGATWHLTRRRVGPLEPTNHLTNGSFEDGFTGWSFAKTTSPFTFTTYTILDARNETLPDEEVNIIAVGGVTGFERKLALRLYGSTSADNYGDLFAWQEVAVSGGVQGRRCTLSARVWYSSSLFTRHPAFNRGLMLARFASPISSAGANGGKTAWYTDMIEWRSSRLDEDTPRDRWVEHSVTIDIPPGASELLHVRLCSPNGLVYYDDVRLDLEDRFEVYQSGAAAIATEVVEHAQDAAYGHTSANLAVIVTGSTGPLRDLVAAHADQAVCWDLITNLTRYDDGCDLRPRYTGTKRYLEVGHPRLGYTRADRPLWSNGSVARLDRASGNGGSAANAVSVRSDNTEAPDWGTASETSSYADSQVHEATGTASIEATRDDLDADAAELLAASLDPTTLTVTLHPDWLSTYLDLLPGDWCPTNVTAGSLSVIGTYRIVGWTLDADDLLRLDMGSREAPT